MSETTLTDVLAVLDLAAAAGARIWIDGGWGVDALLGAQTRPHGDLDIAIERWHLDAFAGALRNAGFAEGDHSRLVHPRGAEVDVHAIVVDADGNGVLGPPEDGNVYPAASLTGRGVLGGRAVDCIAAEWVVRFHDAYRGDEDDRADVRALCDRFGLAVPEQYR